jgi:hypothetical protein
MNPALCFAKERGTRLGLKILWNVFDAVGIHGQILCKYVPAHKVDSAATEPMQQDTIVLLGASPGDYRFG